MRLSRVIAVVLAAAALTVGAMAPAGAHTQLVSTSPEDGAQLSAPPASVSFTFDEDLLPGTATISVNDEAGNVITTQSVEPEAATVSLPWPAEANTGTFQVAYRIASDDGHPVTGAISLTIIGEDATSSAGASATPSSTTAPVETVDGSRGIAAWLVVLIALLLVALMAIAAVVLIRRRHP